MRKMMIALVAMLTMAATGNAMSYEQARNEALFLTDKMAYELNLTDEQYEAAYEINLDYLMGVTSYDDVYGTYWERRNLDLSYILLDWQWNAFRAATYFYRPLYWRDGFWHFGIYARYPHRDYFYFGRPVFYASYRGGHAWHVVGGQGYYYGHRDHFRPAPNASHFGMLDRWNRGDYRNHHHMSRDNGQGHFGGNRNSSTRTTVNGRGSLGGYRSHGGNPNAGRPTTTNRPTTTTHPTTRNTRPTNNTATASPSSQHTSVGSLGGSRNSSASSFSGSRSSSSAGSFSGSGSRSSGSFSSGASRGSGSSHSGGSSTGRSSGGGHSYGGRR